MSRISIITGHYGSGKTNITVNLALSCAKQGGAVTVVDLDIVNPYFRTADFKRLFEANGIALIAPMYANTNLDIPALGFDLQRLIHASGQVLLDVGGDDAGAIALGRYAAQLGNAEELALYYVVNRYRFLTQTAQDTVELLRDIERASKIKATAIINNSNLGAGTAVKDVLASMPYAGEVARQSGLPVAFTTVKRDIVGEFAASSGLPEESLMPVDIFVKPLWDE